VKNLATAAGEQVAVPLLPDSGEEAAAVEARRLETEPTEPPGQQL
jgi:hypothetical protein